jgi:hypothetical protein
MSKIIAHRDKTKVWATQQQKAFTAFQRCPQTRLMVSHNANIPIQNICRYVKNYRDAGTIYIVKVDRCPISGMKAEFLSTDPKYAPKAQLSMFFA